MPTKQSATDFYLENHHSIALLRPISDAAREWVDEHIGENNGFQPYWPDVVIEHRYVADVVQGIVSDGLVCR